MWLRLNIRLQQKLVLIVSSLLGISSLVFLFLVTGIYRDRLTDEHARASMHINRLLQISLENAMLKRDLDGLQKIVEQLGQQDGVKEVFILNPDLKARFASDTVRLNRELKSTLAQRALKQKKAQYSFMQREDGAEVLRSINPVHNQPVCNQCHGPTLESPINGLLVVDYDANNIRSQAYESALIFSISGIAIILLVGIGVWVALYFLIIRRLNNLNRATNRISQGFLGARATVSGQDEIDDLANSFNSMADQVQAKVVELQDSETFLQAVIDALPEGVRVISEDFKILKANKAYCAQVGQTMEQVLSSRCFASSHHRTSPCPMTMVTCPIADYHEKGRAFVKCPQTFTLPDGTIKHIEICAATLELTIDGVKQICTIEAIRDLEQQVRFSQSERLSEIGFLAAGVAHEINNPLTSMQYALHALRTTTNQKSVDEVSRTLLVNYFDLMESEIEKCLKVTKSMLMLSELPSEQSELVDLSETVPQVLQLISFQAEQSNVEIALAIEEKQMRVLGSDSDLRMLALNLFINALHAMPTGGCISVGLERSGVMIKLIVEDCGVGIEQKDLDKIFLPFWSKRADETRGRGLGLSIAKSIVEACGGTICAESEKGLRTTFTVLLPDADQLGDREWKDRIASKSL